MGNLRIYFKCHTADQKVKCIILWSLDNMLQHQHVSYAMTYDILFSLQEIFGDKGILVFNGVSMIYTHI